MLIFRRWQSRRWDRRSHRFIYTDKSGYFVLGIVPIWITKKEEGE